MIKLLFRVESGKNEKTVGQKIPEKSGTSQDIQKQSSFGEKYNAMADKVNCYFDIVFIH